MSYSSRFVLLAGALAFLGCSGALSDKSACLTGAGSTFVYPLMVQWASEYERGEEGSKVTYRSVGSDNGVKNLLSKKVDFACTDAPLTPEELAQAREAGGEALHIPLVLGAVVPAYNLADLKEPLRFTGPLLADIFLGKIHKWNDEALQKLNPEVKLPDKNIVVVHRRDGSGTTNIWTDYLSKVSPEWKKSVGQGTEVKWPTGETQVGNDGVAKYLKETPGSLGYIELSYAYRMDLPFGLVQNREQEFVKASIPSIKTAAANALTEIPDDLRYSLTNAPGKGSYPICGTTWAVVYSKQPPGKGKDLARFVDWMLGEGQSSVEWLFYARLPEALATKAKQKAAEIVK